MAASADYNSRVIEQSVRVAFSLRRESEGVGCPDPARLRARAEKLIEHVRRLIALMAERETRT